MGIENKENLRQMILQDGGAAACGFAPLREVGKEDADRLLRFLQRREYGEMEYLARNTPIRLNPALLLDEGRDPAPGGSVISIAFPYFSGNPYRKDRLRIARYALGDDYHEVLRRRLIPIARQITEATGCEARVCVDTAPILERYWAREAGLGFIGRNHQLIHPRLGSYLFLAEIVTRAPYTPDTPYQPSTDPCGSCDRCLRACPSKTLDNRGFADCHSYLTIEYRGAELPSALTLRQGRIYGCDICQEVCPYNNPQTNPAITSTLSSTSDSTHSPSLLSEFHPREALLDLTPADISRLTPETFATLFRHSPVKRARLTGLLRSLPRLK